MTMIGRQRLRNGLIGHNGLNFRMSAGAAFYATLAVRPQFVVKRAPSATLGKNGDDG